MIMRQVSAALKGDRTVSSLLFRVVRIGAQYFPDLNLERTRLAEAGAELVAIGRCQGDELVAACSDVDGAINYGGRFTAEVIARLPARLRYLVQASTGYDLVDVAAATERGIAVANLPFQCIDEVANHALALLLAANKRLLTAVPRVRRGEWSPRALLPIGPITGETLGLLSFGNIARAVAERAKPFKLHVIAHDPYVPQETIRSHGVEPVEFDELLARSDYLSVHAPLIPATYHLLNASAFARMKPTAIVVNTARGQVIDEEALLNALRNGQIAGAGLDVLEQEPPDPANPLLHMENVVVTPHSAGTSNASLPRNREQALDAMACFLQGKQPDGLLNPSAFRHSR